MIIDIILDRREGAISYDAATHLKAIYDYATDAGMTELATAVDGGNDEEVKAALMRYITVCGYPSALLDYIASVRWTDDATAVAYTQVPRNGGLVTIMETDRMGYAARKAFSLAAE